MNPIGLLSFFADIPPLPPQRHVDTDGWVQPVIYWSIAVVALALLWFLRRKSSKPSQ